MQDIANDRIAEMAVKSAVTLTRQLLEGCVDPEEEPQVASEITVRLTAAQDYYLKVNDPGKAAEQAFHLGYLARHGLNDADRAKAHFAEAANGFAEIGETRQYLMTMIEWGEIDPGLPSAERAVARAIAAGLAAGDDPAADPRRLALAKQRAGDAHGALGLFQALLNEARARADRIRTALLLRDIARVHEGPLRDRLRATEVLEEALAEAEASGNQEAIAMALLRLTDIWIQRRKRPTAHAYFKRVARMEGLTGPQQSLVDLSRHHFDHL